MKDQSQRPRSHPVARTLLFAATPLLGLLGGCGSEIASRPSGSVDALGAIHDPVRALQESMAGQLGGGEGLAGFAALVESAELSKAMQDLQEEAELLARKDPVKAVEALVKLSELVVSDRGPVRQLRESRVAGMLAVRDTYATSDLLGSLGRELFLLGRFEEAEEAMSDWHALEGQSPVESIEIRCWLAACAEVLGRPDESREHVAEADRGRLALAHSSGSAPSESLGARQWQEGAASAQSSAWLSIDELPRMESSGLSFVPSSGGVFGPSGSILESPNSIRYLEEQAMQREAHELAQAESIEREYLRARADWEAEQARHQAESRHYEAVSGRMALFGADLDEIGAAPIDPEIQQKYLRAQEAYSNANGGQRWQ